MGDEVKLFGSWASPHTRRVELALKLKGVPFEFCEEEDWHRSEWGLKCKHIHNTCPVLVHNGRVISESLVILDYIDEAWEHHHHRLHIHHKDHRDFAYYKANARFWAKCVDEKICEAERRFWFAREEEKHMIKEEIHHYLRLLEEELREKEYFGGENFGYLDIVVISMGHWIQVKSEVTKVEIITEHEHPILHKWIHKQHKHDFVHGCLPPREKHIAFYQTHFESGNFRTFPY